MIFARKIPEFYIIIARKINIFPEFRGHVPLPPAPRLLRLWTPNRKVKYTTFSNSSMQMTQICATLSSTNHCDNITRLQSCLSSLHAWFCENGMALNLTKSDAILFGTPHRLKSVSCLTEVRHDNDDHYGMMMMPYFCKA